MYNLTTKIIIIFEIIAIFNIFFYLCIKNETETYPLFNHHYYYFLIILCNKLFLCYYAPPTYRPPYLINNNNDSICNIVYIGDSWAYMHKDHTCTIPQIIESECDCSINIYSYGINGITSKII